MTGAPAAGQILLVNPTADLYGATRAALSVVCHAGSRGYQWTVVLPDDGPAAAAFEQAGSTVVLFPSLTVIRKKSLRGLGALSLLGSMIPSARALTRLIHQRKIDLVYTNTALLPTAATAARRTGRPHVWHIREVFDELGPISLAYARFVARNADVLLCNSRATGAQFPDGTYLQVIHDDWVESTGSDAPPLRVDGSPVIATMGRLSARKGMHVLIEAFARLKQGPFPTARLVIAGACFPGNERYTRHLHDLVAHHNIEDAVTFTSHLNEPDRLYAAADLFCLPTTRPEGFGLVVLEALAHGLPVVVSDHGGALDFVEEGRHGRFAEPGDPASVATACERALRETLPTQQTAQEVRTRFAYPANTRAVVDHFDQMLHGHTADRRDHAHPHA